MSGHTAHCCDILYLLLSVDHVKDVTEVKQLGCRYGDDLKNPKADMGDGEGPVVADVLTARLLSVADKVRLFIPPNLEEGQDDRRRYTVTSELL